jgi:site-specific recombinase XerC
VAGPPVQCGERTVFLGSVVPDRLDSDDLAVASDLDRAGHDGHLDAAAPQQLADRLAAGERWQEKGLVFTTSVGTKMAAGNVRRDFRRALALVPGIDPSEWTPRELRHPFVSVLSDAGVPVEEISRLVGHSGTTVTQLVNRHQLKPVIQTGATVMDQLFGRKSESA